MLTNLWSIDSTVYIYWKGGYFSVCVFFVTFSLTSIITFAEHDITVVNQQSPSFENAALVRCRDIFALSQHTNAQQRNRLYVCIYFHQNTILIIVAVVFILFEKIMTCETFINHFIKVVCKKIKEVTWTKASIILQYTGSIIVIIIIIIAMILLYDFEPFSFL